MALETLLSQHSRKQKVINGVFGFYGISTIFGYLMPNPLQKYVVHSISFQDFLVQAFQIGVDSGKFILLLLYILWDDRPIFMISDSNEQLQQQLEYTLL